MTVRLTHLLSEACMNSCSDNMGCMWPNDVLKENAEFLNAKSIQLNGAHAKMTGQSFHITVQSPTLLTPK